MSETENPEISVPLWVAVTSPVYRVKANGEPILEFSVELNIGDVNLLTIHHYEYFRGAVSIPKRPVRVSGGALGTSGGGTLYEKTLDYSFLTLQAVREAFIHAGWIEEYNLRPARELFPDKKLPRRVSPGKGSALLKLGPGA